MKALTAPRPCTFRALEDPNSDEAREQAEKFLTYTSRGGDPAQWWSAKDFWPKQAKAIKTAIADLRRERRERATRGRVGAEVYR